MNTAVCVRVGRQSMMLARARALFHGFGYVLAFSIGYAIWTAMQDPLVQLAAGNLPSGLQQFRAGLVASLISIVPGPILAPLAINLPARSRAIRGLYIMLAATVMFVWCERLSGGVRYSWNWASLGSILYGLLNTILVVGVCAYYIQSQAAADALLRRRIESDRLRVA